VIAGSSGVTIQHCPCEAHNASGAAPAFLEQHIVSAEVVDRKLSDTLWIRPIETVDRLIIVANDRETSGSAKEIDKFLLARFRSWYSSTSTWS
jgi:hypothetical protein